MRLFILYSKLSGSGVRLIFRSMSGSVQLKNLGFKSLTTRKHTNFLAYCKQLGQLHWTETVAIWGPTQSLITTSPCPCLSALGTSSHLRERLGVVRQRKLPLSLQGVFIKGYNLQPQFSNQTSSPKLFATNCNPNKNDTLVPTGGAILANSGPLNSKAF